jgi:hypothetical protein
MELNPDEVRRTVRHQLAAVIGNPRSPLYVRKKDGCQRAIDFYTTTSFIDVLFEATALFWSKQGRYPDLVNPVRFSDKVFWSMFFADFKIPETGNKLLTGTLIPDEVRDIISVPEIVWRSREAVLPGSDVIPDGIYYLKTNHGCNMYRRIRYPLQADERAALEKEFSDFLGFRYGMRQGEWWYNAYEREVFLERNVCEEVNSIVWNHLVFNGEVVMISIFRKTDDGADATLVDPDFKLMDFQNPNRSRVDFVKPSREVRQRMRRAAEAIGRPFSFARVDILMGDGDELYLSEVTLTPGASLTAWRDDLDHWLGSLWKLR